MTINQITGRRNPHRSTDVFRAPDANEYLLGMSLTLHVSLGAIISFSMFFLPRERGNSEMFYQ